MQGGSAAPPAALMAFLDSLSLSQYASTLVKLGYDDVDDLQNFDTDSISSLRASLEREQVPIGHIDKLIRAINKRIADAAAREAQPAPQPPAAQPPAPPPPALPSAPEAAAAAATASMLEAAAAAAASPMEIAEYVGEYDEEAVYGMGAAFVEEFIRFCTERPGALGASTAAVQLLHALAITADALMEEGEEEGEEYDDGYGDYAGYDDDDWRP